MEAELKLAIGVFWLSEETRVASAISEIRKKITLNKLQLTNKIMKCTRETVDRGVRRVRLGVGLGCGNFAIGVFLDTTRLIVSMLRCSVAHYKGFGAVKASA